MDSQIKSLKSDNVKLQRFVIKGPKGSLLAEQNKDMRE